MIFTCSAGLYAQEAVPTLQFSGSFKSGLRVQSEVGLGHIADLYSDTVSMDWGNNSGHAYRLEINALYDTGFWGIQAGVRQQHAKRENEATLTFHEIFGYLNALDKKLNVKIGVINHSVWNTRGIKGVVLDNGTGVRAEFSPIQGLKVGAFFGSTGKLKTQDGESLAAFLKTVTLGASYDGTGFYVVGAYRPKGLPKGTRENPYLDKDGLVSNQFVAGVGFTGIKNLTITGEFLFADGFHEAGKNSNYHWEINQDITYQFGLMTVGFEFFQRPNGSDGIKGDFEAELGPKVRYALNDSMTIGLDVPIILAPDTSLTVKPSYTWKVGKGSSFVVFDKLNILPKVQNTLQFDFVFAF